MPRATVESVETYDVADDTVTLQCRVAVDDGEASDGDTVTLPDRTDPVQLAFLSPRVFRFVFDAVPEAGGPTTTMEVDRGAVEQPVDLTVTERGEDLLIETGALTVVIGLASWSFEVRDADGYRLLTEQHQDVTAKGERRVDPLGYTAERTNRWPLKLTEAGSAFTLGGDEHLYGFGEQFTEFDVRGQTIEAWVTQPNGAETGHAYKNVPFFLSTKGYGLFVDTTSKVTFDVGDTSVVTHDVTVDADTFSFVFIGESSFPAVLETYTALTGRAPRVPDWSYGVWLSRASYESQSEVEAIADRARAESLPCDVLHLDPGWLDGLCSFEWDRAAFPDPKGMIEALHADDFRVCLWEYPYVLSRTDAFDTARDAGYLVEDGTGAPYVLDRLSWSTDRGGIVDFTDPAAREWWRERHGPLLDMGVDAFKVDFGEYLPNDAVLADGRSGRAVRNEFPNRYAATVWSAMEDAGVETPVLWTRSGWAGGQQYPVHWGGDPAATWESMAASFRGGLSLGLSGYAYWSVDIGGFHGDPTPELYVRWAQASLLGTSHARFHGTTPREPWAFGEEVLDIVREYAIERYRLLPYLRTLGAIAAERGLPVMRPLVLEFEDDHGARTCGDELMVGPALLVAPILQPGGRRSVYLPPGEWVDYWTGETVDGGQTLQRGCALADLPVYVRAGTIHPRTEAVGESVPTTAMDPLTLRAPLADGAATGEVLDPATDALQDVSVHQAEATLRVEAGLSSRVDVEVENVDQSPDRVTVDGTTLDPVEADPAPGEWMVTDDGARVRVRGP
ncbi:MAG: TIM-barrel domain-containing protein [Halobacteriaceae archaeon]